MKQTIKQSLTVVKSISTTGVITASIRVLHLGHPSDPKYGMVEELTEDEYRRFVWAHTWPRPKGAT